MRSIWMTWKSTSLPFMKTCNILYPILGFIALSHFLIFCRKRSKYFGIRRCPRGLGRSSIPWPRPVETLREFGVDPQSLATRHPLSFLFLFYLLMDSLSWNIDERDILVDYMSNSGKHSEALKVSITFHYLHRYRPYDVLWPLINPRYSKLK